MKPVLSRVLTTLFAPIAFMQPLQAQSTLGGQNPMVAMLHSVNSAGRFESTICGAAILLSTSDNRTLLLTAKHVVDSIDDENSLSSSHQAPLHLAAEFYAARGRYFEVRPLQGVFNRNLDYAVLEVIGLANPADIKPESWKLTGSAIDTTLDNSVGVHFKGVRAIGNDNCKPWSGSQTVEKILSVGGTDISFETRFVAKGSSGGALFAEDGALVGMVVEVDASTATARSIDIILSDLAAKNVSVELTHRISTEPFVPYDISLLPTRYREIVSRARAVKASAIAKSGEGARIRVESEYFAALARASKKAARPDVGTIKLSEHATYFGQILQDGGIVTMTGAGVIETVGGPDDGQRLYCNFDRSGLCIGGVGYLQSSSQNAKAWFGWSGDIESNHASGAGEMFGSMGEHFWTDFARNRDVAVTVGSDGSVYEGGHLANRNGLGVLWDKSGRLFEMGIWKDGKLLTDETSLAK